MNYKKSPARDHVGDVFGISAPQGYGDFCLMGNDKPQPHFLYSVCGCTYAV